MPLSREAVARDLPLLAICRGVQVLNVAAGGTLVQDIPVRGDRRALNHSIDLPKDHIAHAVPVTPGRLLAAALGAPRRPTPAPSTAGITRPSAGSRPSFVVSAVSPDGIVEAIERPGVDVLRGRAVAPGELLEDRRIRRTVRRVRRRGAQRRSWARL